MQPLEHLHFAIRYADEPCFAFSLKGGHRPPGFFESARLACCRAVRGDGPAELIQIEGINLEAPQARIRLSPNARRPEILRDVAECVPYQAALRENLRVICPRQRAQASRDNELGVAESVGRGG